MSKEIWSNKFGTNPKEGIHKFLIANYKGYKRGNLSKVINEYSEKTGNKETIETISNNFNRFKDFICQHFKQQQNTSAAI